MDPIVEARQALVNLLNDREVIDQFSDEDEAELLTVVGMLGEYQDTVTIPEPV